MLEGLGVRGADILVKGRKSYLTFVGEGVAATIIIIVFYFFSPAHSKGFTTANW